MVLAPRILGAALALLTAGCAEKPGAASLDLGTQAQIGYEFIQQRGCPTCHQSAGDGDGILAGATSPAPGTMAFAANLTPDVTTGLGGWADIEVVRAMRYGVDNQSVPLCPPMPHFDGSNSQQPMMTDVEANAIVAYLRALPPVKRAIPASRCPQKKLHD